jgi:hypothetical protein
VFYKFSKLSGPGALHHRYQIDRRGWKSVYSDSLEKLEEILLEDILHHINCQAWSEMK